MIISKKDKWIFSRLNKEWKLERFVKMAQKDHLLSNGSYHIKPRFYNKKIVVSGENVQIYTYENSLPINYKNKSRIDYSKNKNPKELNDAIVNKSLNRTRNNIKNLIDCNVNDFSKFMTLTYAKTALDREQVLKDLNLFTKRFKYYFGEKLRYVGVLEHQKERGKKEGNEGSYHFHLIVFNDFKIDLTMLDKKVWTYGSCNTKKVDCTSNLGRYLMKYITKEVYLEDKLFNKKSLFNSQGLKRPIQEYTLGGNYTSNLIESLEDCTYQKDYDIFVINDKTGEVIENKASLREYKLSHIKMLT